MNALPFDGTILIIHALDSLFNYERKITREEVQPHFNDLAAAEWGRLTDNFLKLNVEQHSKSDSFDDDQWQTWNTTSPRPSKPWSRRSKRDCVRSREVQPSPLDV